MLQALQDVRRRRVLVASTAAAMILAAIGLPLVLRSDDPAPGSRSNAGSPTAEPQATATFEATATAPSELLETSDPETFAREVATRLFAWDTASTAFEGEYAGPLLTVADPTGDESAGLAADIANYFPTPAMWATLRQYRTRQWLEITSAGVPETWSRALAEASPDQLLPGTTAYTITGVRHRAGIWEGRDVATHHEISFTVFMVCAPTYPTCQLLRLSLPDKPLT